MRYPTLSLSRTRTFFLMASLSLIAAACSGDDGKDGKDGAPGDDGGSQMDHELDPDEDAPGVNVVILSVKGGTGQNGNFRAGDHIKVRYTLKMDDDTDWVLGDLNRGRALVSGPTFNYQRVIAEQTDVLTASVKNSDGSYTYTFSQPIPATYLAPFNDTTSFGAEDGELTGQSLLGGTYSVSIYFRWDYTVGSATFRDQGDAVADFLYGGATTIESRGVVAQENCNQCHVDLQAHGGSRKDVRLCLMCHTAGAEDDNDPNVEGGTPGVSVEFKVMIHKIHSGQHLPSVLGVATNNDGTRNYDATPVPYKVVGFSVADFSEVGFPVWPNLSFPLPRDFGYSSLTDPQKAQEDAMRTGPAGCYACHGDPDGDGPLEAPPQGDLIRSQLTRRACGACHDDIDWSLPYVSNAAVMPPQADDTNCVLCHQPSGDSLAVYDAHLHPMLDPSFDPGLHYEILDLAEAGARDGDGTLDVGEKIELTFTITDDDGNDVDPADIASMSVVVSGPTNNYNLLNNASFPAAALSGAQPYTMNVPELVQLERVGVTTGGADSFTTSKAPHWAVTGAATTVWARSATSGGNSTMSAAAEAPSNYIDLASTTNFDRDDYIVIEDGGGGEEYLRVQWVDGNRLWFSSPYATAYAPGLRFDHGSGTSVKEVTLTQLTEGVEYDLVEALGRIDEISIPNGQVVVASYTTDFVIPSEFPLALNSSPDVGEEFGKWTGKPLVDGTYTVGLWGNRNLTLTLQGETNSYRGTSPSVGQDFLVGDATDLEAYDKIESADACMACHKELMFHGGGRRGYLSCLVCHGTAGAEDRPQYVAPGAPETEDLTVNFRTMLHKIHMGAELAYASSYTVVGFGSGYPNNYTAHSYDEVEFPVLPRGVQNCASCHGDSDAWHSVPDRDHPDGQTKKVLEWTLTCGACHDSDAAQAHIELQTSQGGVESCAICHSEEDELNVEFVHKVR